MINTITIDGEVVKVCHHMSEIKNELASIEHILKRFYNKKQFFKWLKAETAKNGPVEAEMLYSPGLYLDLSYFDVGSSYGDVMIEGLRITETSINQIISNYKSDFIKNNPNVSQDILDSVTRPGEWLNEGHEYCVVEDDEGVLWLLKCDID